MTFDLFKLKWKVLVRKHTLIQSRNCLFPLHHKNPMSCCLSKYIMLYDS